jgi:hypothetical protein
MTCPQCNGPTSVVDSRSTTNAAVPARLRELAQLWGGTSEDWRCRRRQCRDGCGAAPVWTVELYGDTLRDMLVDAHGDRTLADTLGGGT